MTHVLVCIWFIVFVLFNLSAATRSTTLAAAARWFAIFAATSATAGGVQGVDNPDQRLAQDLPLLTASLADTLAVLAAAPFNVIWYTHLTHKASALQNSRGVLCFRLHQQGGGLASVRPLHVMHINCMLKGGLQHAGACACLEL